MKDQVRELLTNYGKIDIIWLDFSFTGGGHGKGRDDWDSVGLLKMVRELQPGIIVNDRLDLLDVPGGWDFRTPEQFKPREWVTMNGERVPWETCQTFSGSWGYYRDETSWKSAEQLIELLIDTVSKGGNLLMNVGPTARGTFDERAQERLAAFGRWMQVNGRVHLRRHAGAGRLQGARRTRCSPTTRRRNRLYVHLLAWPMGELVLPGYADKVKYAQLLHDALRGEDERAAVHDLDQRGRPRGRSRAQAADPEARRRDARGGVAAQVTPHAPWRLRRRASGGDTGVSGTIERSAGAGSPPHGRQSGVQRRCNR